MVPTIITLGNYRIHVPSSILSGFVVGHVLLLFSPANLSTMLIPGVVLLRRFYVSTPVFSNEETLLIHLLFVATTFFIPVGFLNVSRTGRYLSAFDFRWTLPTLRRNFRNYTEAWVASGIMPFLHPL